MNKTLRSIAVVCLAAWMMLALVACGGNNSKYAGTYDMVSMDIGGMTITADDLKAAAPDANIQLVLKEDGSFTMTALAGSTGMETSTTEGTWKEKGSDLTLTVDGATNIATVDGDNLTLVEDDVSILFTKAA